MVYNSVGMVAEVLFYIRHSLCPAETSEPIDKSVFWLLLIVDIVSKTRDSIEITL